MIQLTYAVDRFRPWTQAQRYVVQRIARSSNVFAKATISSAGVCTEGGGKLIMG